MTPAQAKQMLLSNPDKFIKYYPLSLGGIGITNEPVLNLFGEYDPIFDFFDSGTNSNYTSNISNIKTYYIKKKVSEELRLPNPLIKHHFGATRPGQFFPAIKHEISSFIIDGNNWRNSGTVSPNSPLAQVEPISAHSVPMVNYQRGMESKLIAYKLDQSADIMITGQLTGCVFCWAINGNEVLCTHIKPNATIIGANLHDIIAQNGKFAINPNAQVNTFGRYNYGLADNRRAIILGVRSSGTWSFYAQITTSDTYTNRVDIALKFSIYGTIRHL